MGVLVDYVAASSVDLERLGPHLSSGPAGMGLPYVDCKGWLDGLAGLVAELTGRDLSEFGDDVSVWPEGAADDEAESWLVRVPPEVTRALAGVSDQRLAGYADDELLTEYEIDRNLQLRDLARSAMANGRDIYCWSSL
jgi:hypothetical protein